MVETLFNLLGINANTYNLDDNVVFVTVSIIIIYCICYTFCLIQRVLDRCTSKGVSSK